MQLSVFIDLLRKIFNAAPGCISADFSTPNPINYTAAYRPAYSLNQLMSFFIAVRSKSICFQISNDAASVFIARCLEHVGRHDTVAPSGVERKRSLVAWLHKTGSNARRACADCRRNAATSGEVGRRIPMFRMRVRQIKNEFLNFCVRIKMSSNFLVLTF